MSSDEIHLLMEEVDVKSSTVASLEHALTLPVSCNGKLFVLELAARELLLTQCSTGASFILDTIPFADLLQLKLSHNVLDLHYVRYHGNELRVVEKQFHTRPDHVTRRNELIAATSAAIACQSRPRHLLVFVNPSSGQGRSLNVWREARKLFERYGVVVEEQMTIRRGHARDFLATYQVNVTHFDGVLACGGDGIVHEVLNGLLLASNPFVIQPDSEILPPAVRFGVIPAGSTDAFCTTLHGTTDWGTAVLQIILGSSLGCDVPVLFSEKDTFLAFQCSLLGYGFFGEVNARGDKLQFLGKSRFDVAGARVMFCSSPYPAEVELWSEPKSGDGTCLRNCSTCEDRCEPVTAEHVILSGDVWSVHSCPHATRSSMNLMGLQPSHHTGDGRMYVAVIRDSARWKLLRYFLRISLSDSSMYSVPEITVFATRRLRITAPAHHSPYWNVDGEPAHTATIQVLMKRQLVQVFSRGVSVPIKTRNLQRTLASVAKCSCLPRRCYGRFRGLASFQTILLSAAAVVALLFLRWAIS